MQQWQGKSNRWSNKISFFSKFERKKLNEWIDLQKKTTVRWSSGKKHCAWRGCQSRKNASLLLRTKRRNGKRIDERGHMLDVIARRDALCAAFSSLSLLFEMYWSTDVNSQSMPTDTGTGRERGWWSRTTTTSEYKMKIFLSTESFLSILADWSD